MNTYQQAFDQAMDLIKQEIPWRNVLLHLTAAAENAVPGTVTSILLLDVHGLLRNGASPKLPADYLMAIDGLRPHANIGTCAAAAATGTIVVTEDFYEDSKWSELRHFPMALGFKSGWSMPIIGIGGNVLGTFGTYYTSKRTPDEAEISGIALLANAAALAIEAQVDLVQQRLEKAGPNQNQ